jgi:hypothetical protein
MHCGYYIRPRRKILCTHRTERACGEHQRQGEFGNDLHPSNSQVLSELSPSPEMRILYQATESSTGKKSLTDPLWTVKIEQFAGCI